MIELIQPSMTPHTKTVGIVVVIVVYHMYWVMQDFYHQQYPPPTMRRKEGLIQAYLGLVLGW